MNKWIAGLLIMSCAAASHSAAAWTVQESTSPIDDSKTVLMWVNSSEQIRDSLGRLQRATIKIQCVENRTGLFVEFGGHYMSHVVNGGMTFRVDSKPAFTRSMRESTDNSSLGQMGGNAIGIIRQMLGGDVLTVRATPVNSNSVTVQFPIEGIEEQIQPLRGACNW
ncbi:type VI secretion system-associated protein TagO [Halomonas venusta]|uniref:type VI secretion system-associated protein TagO n=1 Tax=Vreelandella venusta TaxID=44935 RepID=UPI00295EC6D3|nr:type VI secretion system-associated protein TagO [Halomonas venusta]MDW0360801.1 type VI secretion system-associated protein TagO [Halomonas venusta]